jgi:hypothetical protein
MELQLQEIKSHFTFQMSLLRLCQISDTEMSKLEQMVPAAVPAVTEQTYRTQPLP